MNALWDADDWLIPKKVQSLVTTARRPLAYTTVMTILVRLWEKGMIDRRRDGRAYAYRPVATRDEWAAQRMHELLDASGDRLLTLNHFVDTFNSKEATQLRGALERRKRR